jgi:hypothetical protein
MKLAAAVEQFQAITPWTRYGVAAFLAWCQAEDKGALEVADLLAFFHELAGQGYA